VRLIISKLIIIATSVCLLNGKKWVIPENFRSLTYAARWVAVHYTRVLKEVIAARAGHSSAVLVLVDACVINQSLYIYAYTCLTNLFQSLEGTAGTITTLKQAVNNASSWQQEKPKVAEQFSTMIAIKHFKRI
jgi:hypothetical protein